ncbi:uncharacterized protein LOC117642841 [Thrips palmi]|uniref:Uncharacterized protein LOC117642841 n=1 Tax=Thrips palmi TaxID=161013 RepID=A0A6P8YTD3_THRPL|nr:uncharacterized protein LOC117642841 [Thrips palmi]
MAIANIPRHIRTHVNSILLVALYKEKNFDHQSVYGKIVEDLKVLETDSVSIPEHGTCGDNLGHHAVGGFNENFSRSIYFCRYCLIDRKSFHSNHHSQFPLRTPQSHGDCLRGAACNRKGVKFDSEFNKLAEFHVCNPGLASCCAHDLFEGVVAHDMVLFINYFVSGGWFTIPQLNAKIDNFKYDSADYRDKPNTFKEGCEKLSGGAMQIWCFLRLFPLFIKDLVDWEEKQDNLVWKAVLLLNEIVELVMATVIYVSVLPYLDAIIYDYLDLRVVLFPNVLLRPKHHYLTHYYFLLYFFGPMCLTWSMRFESKHSFFKRFARMLRNFRNVLFPLGIKHELFMSYLRLGVELRCDLKPTLSGEFHANVYSLDIQRALQANLPPLMQECVSIVIKGTLYKKGSLLLVQQSHYQCDVQFGRIVLILYDNNTNVFFLVEVMEAEFMPHLRVYKLGARKM